MNKIKLNHNLSGSEIIRLLDAMGDDYTLEIINRIKNEIEENIISELNSEIMELKQELEKHEDNKPYVEFFNDCFLYLEGYYPCPSVTNERDTGIIFDAILYAENARGKK